METPNAPKRLKKRVSLFYCGTRRECTAIIEVAGSILRRATHGPKVRAVARRLDESWEFGL